MECQRCNKLDREIKRLKKIPNPTEDEEKLRIQTQRDLQLHLDRASRARKKYWATRAKAIQPDNAQRGDISMIIDGAGAQARSIFSYKLLILTIIIILLCIISNYCPRYARAEKNEPARHEMLKIKSTYIKVGGCFLVV